MFATSVTLITLAIDTIAGYAFARLRFPGRTGLFVLIIATLMIPTAVLIAPLYIMVSRVPGWTHAGVNTYLGMILPMFASPLEHLHDAAVHVDAAGGARRGGSTRRRFGVADLPQDRPAADEASDRRARDLTFMFQWVNFLWPLVITTTDDMKTLTVGVASFQGQFVTNWGVISPPR